jgi:amino acid transporter
MGRTLERDLGLPAVVAISMGAMVGSGIFILPALAYGVVGPAVVLVYVLAGVLVLPAALSQSELATAMPKAGGAYLYIERGMGPLLGTVAGLGTWFSLTFKSALALVGGVPYVLLLFAVPDGLVTPLALGLAVALVGLNLLGAKQTGLTQVAVVAVMLVALAWFAVGGSRSVDPGSFAPFSTGGTAGLLAAIGLVFVSYAGVTKVASLAEEIERPDRNIPLGIVGSLVVTTALYALIVFVMVGVVPGDELAGSATPMALAAERSLGDLGVVAVVLAAILALVSTANAGVLSASRYPFAMARDRLVPDLLGSVNDRLGTPSTAITATGVVVLVLVAFVPITEIAKLAGAFQFLVFALVNLAVIVFREGEAEYDPAFRSPLYPWVQLFGAGSSLLLVTQMGLVPLVGAGLIVAGGVAWFLVYGRRRVDREGIALATARARLDAERLADTRATLADGGGGSVVVATTAGTTPAAERRLLRVAVAVAAARGTGVRVVRFETVPDQQPLDYAAEVRSQADVRFEAETDAMVAGLGTDVPVTVGEVVSHDVAHSVVSYVRHRRAGVLVMERHPPGLGRRGVRSHTGWIRRHVPCDLLFVEGAEGVDGGSDAPPERVRVVGDGGPYRPFAVFVADALGAAVDRPVTFADPTVGASDDRTDARVGYHDDLRRTVGATAEATGATGATDGGTGATTDRVDDPAVELVVVDGRTRSSHVAGTVVHVEPGPAYRPGRLRRLVRRLVY